MIARGAMCSSIALHNRPFNISVLPLADRLYSGSAPVRAGGDIDTFFDNSIQADLRGAFPTIVDTLCRSCLMPEPKREGGTVGLPPFLPSLLFG